MREKQLRFFQGADKEEPKTFEKRRIVKVPLDTVILLGIINLFVVITFFSMGIEKGRRATPAIRKNRFVQVQQKNITPKPKESVPKTEKQEPSKLKKEYSEEKSKPAEITYIIQVASYARETAAQREKEYLKKAGFSAELLKKGKYIVIYVGNFKTQKEAEKAKSLLRNRHGDCFVKKL